MKHYPLTVAGEKAAACVELHWSTATVSIKFSHRKGQVVKIDPSDIADSNAFWHKWVDEYLDYTVVRFEVKTHYFNSPLHAIEYCADCISRVRKFVNFDANQELVSKELRIILG